MIYIVFFLLLLGGWQAFMKGSKSQMISGVALWLAVIVLLVGLVLGKIEMSIVLFGLFVLASVFILMQIYRLSTYHRYFPRMFPVLLGYGVLVGYLLFVFNFSQYFLWHVIITIYFLTTNYRKQQQAKVLASLTEDEEQKKLLDKSVSDTIKFHLLSSVVYVVTVVISFLYFYNA
ncbi:MAG: hypothetical protein ABIJ28_02950 [Patescibacteria group bacterium]